MTREGNGRIKLLLVQTSGAGANGSMSRYARHVQSALVELPGFNERFELRTLHLTMPERLQSRFPLSVGTWLNHLWLILNGTSHIKRCNPDIVHLLDGSYGYLLNQLGSIRAVVTVHDLIPLLQQRDAFGRDRTSFLARGVVRKCLEGLRRCSKLISVSQSTRLDLVRYAAMEVDSIAVVPNALDEAYSEPFAQNFSADPTVSEVRRPIVLHVGHNGLYKNREGVLRIFARIRESTDARLKLVGPLPTAPLLRLVKELDLERCVEFVGNVDDRQLRDLYEAASLLLFPSLYEGFGWPPLEAMACGCPVVCSNEGSLAEVVGDAALTAPAREEQELAEQCLRVLNNPQVAADLRQRGLAHVRQFTLARMGEQLLKVYESILVEAPQLRDRSRSATANSVGRKRPPTEF